MPTSQKVLRVVPFKSRSFWKNKQPHFFRLVSANGRTVAQSEGYARKASRDKTVALIVGAKIVIAK